MRDFQGYGGKIRRGARNVGWSFESAVWDAKLQAMEGRSTLRKSPLDEQFDDIVNIDFLGGETGKKGRKSQKSMDQRIVDDILSPFTEFDRRFR